MAEHRACMLVNEAPSVKGRHASLYIKETSTSIGLLLRCNATMHSAQLLAAS